MFLQRTHISNLVSACRKAAATLWHAAGCRLGRPPIPNRIGVPSPGIEAITGVIRAIPNHIERLASAGIALARFGMIPARRNQTVHHLHLAAAVGVLGALECLTVCTPTNAFGQAPGVTNWYQFESTLTDAAGSANGTASGTIGYATGICGQSLSVTAAGEVSLGNAVGNFGASDFSVAFWLRTAGTNNSSQIMSKRAVCARASLFDIRTNGAVQPDGLSIEILRGSSDLTTSGVLTQGPVLNGEWRFLVFTRQGTTTRVYVDGVWNNERVDVVDSISNSANLRLNGGPCVGVDGTTRMVGQIDELQLYDRALGAGEVAQLFATRSTFVISEPQSVSTCPAGTAAFSVTASGTGPFTYQWQIETAPDVWENLTASPLALPCGGSASADAPTAASTQIAVTPCPAPPSSPTQPQHFQIRCLVTNACGSVTSNEATLTICPADINCSGDITVQDIFDFLAFYFASDPRGDFNGVGGWSVQDIFDFLAAYFAGCP